MPTLKDPAVEAYVLAHHTPADEVLTDLAAVTAAEFAEDAGMQVSADEGRLLGMLTALTGARFAVEVGVFTGYSALCIARALAPGGRLLACDIDERYAATAREHWRRAGVEDRIELRIAPAAETLAALPPEPPVDFAFIDADKGGYPRYYELLVPRLRPGGLIAIDNVLLGGQVLDPRRPAHRAVADLNETVRADERVESVMLPVRDGLTLVRKRDPRHGA
jgi:caffeoyl-CoA O-methyltransferase